MKLKNKSLHFKKIKFQFNFPKFNTFLLFFMTISMILSFPYMGLMCFAFICLISD